MCFIVLNKSLYWLKSSIIYFARTFGMYLAHLFSTVLRGLWDKFQGSPDGCGDPKRKTYFRLGNSFFHHISSVRSNIGLRQKWFFVKKNSPLWCYCPKLNSPSYTLELRLQFILKYPPHRMYLQYLLEDSSLLGVGVHCLQFTMGLCVWMKWSEGSEVSLHSTLSLCGLWAGFPLTAAVLNDYVKQEGDV